MNSALAKRFWSKVKLAPGDACWEWQAALFDDGYGAFQLTSIQTRRASRVAWLLATGQEPECVCHHCDNPLCVRPSHLYAGDPALNMQDKMKRGRWKGGGPAKFSAQVIKGIRAAQGTQAEIAKQFGVSKGYVSDIRLRKYRKDP